MRMHCRGCRDSCISATGPEDRAAASVSPSRTQQKNGHGAQSPAISPLLSCHSLASCPGALHRAGTAWSRCRSKVFLVPACWVKAPCAVGQGYQNQDVQNACIYTLLGPPADLSHGQAQSAQTREARVLWPYYPAAKTQENSLNHRGSAYSKV